MKKSMLMLVPMLFGLAFGAMARHNDATQDAMKAFSEKYPNARMMKWADRSDMDIAKFKMGDKKEFAFFAFDGSWIKTETKLPFMKDLPMAVQNGFNESNYESWEIDRINKVESPEGKSYTVQVHTDMGPDGSVPSDGAVSYVLAFDDNGSLMQKNHVNGNYIEKR